MGGTKCTCKCYECGEVIKKGESKAKAKLFRTPYDKNSKVIYFHDDNDEGRGSCYNKAFDTSWSDFRIFECAICGRIINTQCPSNGWHEYTRKDENGNDICLQCFDNQLFQYGVSREEFEDTKIPGTFATDEDFIAHGFEEVDGFHSYFVNGHLAAKAYCEWALKLIDEGYLIANEYERMAIGGLEGYVSMWAKKKAAKKTRGGHKCRNKKMTSGSDQSDSASP